MSEWTGRQTRKQFIGKEITKQDRKFKNVLGKNENQERTKYREAEIVSDQWEGSSEKKFCADQQPE